MCLIGNGQRQAERSLNYVKVKLRRPGRYIAITEYGLSKNGNVNFGRTLRLQDAAEISSLGCVGYLASLI